MSDVQQHQDQAAGRRVRLPRRPLGHRAGRGPPAEPRLRHRPPELRDVATASPTRCIAQIELFTKTDELPDRRLHAAEAPRREGRPPAPRRPRREAHQAHQRAGRLPRRAASTAPTSPSTTGTDRASLNPHDRLTAGAFGSRRLRVVRQMGRNPAVPLGWIGTFRT